MKAAARGMSSSFQKVEEERMKCMAKPYIFTPTIGFINLYDLRRMLISREKESQRERE